MSGALGPKPGVKPCSLAQVTFPPKQRLGWLVEQPAQRSPAPQFKAYVDASAAPAVDVGFAASPATAKGICFS